MCGHFDLLHIKIPGTYCDKRLHEYVKEPFNLYMAGGGGVHCVERVCEGSRSAETLLIARFSMRRKRKTISITSCGRQNLNTQLQNEK